MNVDQKILEVQEKNKIEIEERNGVVTFKLNGISLKKIIDYTLEKKTNGMEITLKLSVDSLKLSTFEE